MISNLNTPSFSTEVNCFWKISLCSSPVCDLHTMKVKYYLQSNVLILSLLEQDWKKCLFFIWTRWSRCLLSMATNSTVPRPFSISSEILYWKPESAIVRPLSLHDIRLPRQVPLRAVLYSPEWSSHNLAMFQKAPSSSACWLGIKPATWQFPGTHLCHSILPQP